MTRKAVKMAPRYEGVVANYELDVPGLRLVTDLGDLLDITAEGVTKGRRLLVLLDEVHLWLPARQSLKLPPSVMQKLSQTRKSGFDLWWTAQHYGRVDKALRDITNWMWYCTAWRLPFWDFSDSKPRWFVGRCYEPEEFRKRGKHVMKVITKFEMETAKKYDTFGQIKTSSHLQEVKDFYREKKEGVG
jgi:hypothetical protein